MEKYIEIAKKYLVNNLKNLTKGLCFTIRKSELDNSINAEGLIKDKINSICYDFSEVRNYTDGCGIEYLLFYNV